MTARHPRATRERLLRRYRHRPADPAGADGRRVSREPVHCRRQRRRHGRDGCACSTPPAGIRQWVESFAPAAAALSTQHLDSRSSADRNRIARRASASSSRRGDPRCRRRPGTTRSRISAGSATRSLEVAPRGRVVDHGLSPDDSWRALKRSGIAWFATATTLAEARQAQEAGADAVIAQGFEAGGHRGSFDQAPRSGNRSGSSRCCRGWPIISTSRSSPPAASATAAAWPRR